MAQNGQVALIRRVNDSLARRMGPLQDFVIPAADIYETGDAFILKVDMPGVQKESISLNIELGKILVKGLQASTVKERTDLLFSEIRKANYFREFNIGNGIDPDKIQANFENGVLSVTLHKNESMRAREIPIK